eukprot:6174826-Pleurochrysis_carterae.AAC.2
MCEQYVLGLRTTAKRVAAIASTRVLKRSCGVAAARVRIGSLHGKVDAREKLVGVLMACDHVQVRMKVRMRVRMRIRVRVRVRVRERSRV